MTVSITLGALVSNILYRHEDNLLLCHRRTNFFLLWVWTGNYSPSL